MQKSATYRLIVQLTALLLLTGVMLPTGLHAKQLVDYCTAMGAENGGTPAGAGSSSMAADHSCCPENQEVPVSDDTAHDYCGESFVCACHIARAPLSDQNWTAPNGIIIVIPVSTAPEIDTGRMTPVSSATELYATSPLFLLNSTFLN